MVTLLSDSAFGTGEKHSQLRKLDFSYRLRLSKLSGWMKLYMCRKGVGVIEVLESELFQA